MFSALQTKQMCTNRLCLFQRSFHTTEYRKPKILPYSTVDIQHFIGKGKSDKDVF